MPFAYTVTHRALLASLFWVLMIALFATILAAPLVAKDTALTAIVLFSGPDGPSYVQITDVLINGKNEVRLCGPAPKIDKSSYGKLTKIILSSGASVEYGSNGLLTLTRDTNSDCIVPGNLKFDKNGPVTPAELAAKAVLQSRVLTEGPNSAGAAPALKPGVKIVFVSSPDVELAEYLRADRASTIPLWQGYIGKYPTGTHIAKAKQSLASLFVKEAENDFQAYKAASSSAPPAYETLKNSKMRADQALAVVPNDSAATQVNNEIHAQIMTLIEEGAEELKAYQKALNSHTAGYAHLTAARGFAEGAFEIDPQFEPTLNFQGEVNRQADAIESTLHASEFMVESKKFDDGLAAIAAYRAFAGELPRVAAIVDSAYKFHFDRGQQLSAAPDWEGAVNEFQKAAAIKQTQEVAEALKGAEAGLTAFKDKNAAAAALQQSQGFGQQHDYIEAYEILANLPPPQRSLVAEEMERLSPAYIDSASKTAKDIQKAHDPIRGLADEVEIERAYGYLQRAYALGNDPALKDRMADLADRLSEYYLDQAKRYSDKPLGSGAGLAWSNLDKALQYKASNLDAVRDEVTKDSAPYQMRSKLSIRVVFRDQTSRRDSAGFADQLADAIATGLETSGLPVKVIRPGESPALEPNFQLIGDVLQHGRTLVPTSTPRDSQYRAGEQELPNDTWNKANRDYEAASLELQGDQGALQAAITHGKKKEIEEANAKVATAQKKVEDTHAKLDSIPRTLPVDILKPYTYTEKTVNLTAVVQLQFRILDTSGSQVQGTVPVSRDANQKFIILENVKPEDTTGIKVEGTVPDEIQFLTDVENTTRDALIKSVQLSVAELPSKVFDQARKRAEDGDNDGAAELYILYLNSIPVVKSPERQQAEHFLLEQYNIRRTFSPSS